MQPGVPQSHQAPTRVCPATATVEEPVGPVRLSVRECENKSGRARMETAATRSRFIGSSKADVADSEIAVSNGGLIRHLVVSHLAQTAYSREAFLKLANALIHFAEQAFAVRDLSALEEASHALMNLPVTASRQIGTYYYAFAIRRKGQTDDANALLQSVADDAPIIYRARAIQTLGGIHRYLAQLDEALRFQIEALRVAPDRNAGGLQARLMAQFEIATIKSLNEDHKGALAILESVAPLVGIVARQSPLYFYIYHNELAVEFGELDRIREAEAACAVALASPFAQAYPEWSATRDEIAAKRVSATRSVVAINRAPKAEPSREPQRHCNRRPMKAVGFIDPASNKVSFQRSVIPNPATAIMALNAMSILERVLSCIGPRAPPARNGGCL